MSVSSMPSPSAPPAEESREHLPENSLKVYRPGRRTARRERIVALGAVLVPAFGTLAAVIFSTIYGISTVDLALFFSFYILTALGIVIGYHRLASHRSFSAARPVAAFFYVLGSMAAQGPVLWWAAIHRRHHKTADGPGDPHSPYIRDEKPLGPWRGFWNAHLGWLFVHEATTWQYYIPDLLKERTIFAINRHYFFWVGLGLALPALIGWYASGGAWQGAVGGLLWGGLVRIFAFQHATWCINSVCHIFGTRPYHARDMARNNFFLIILTLGDGWHNHHHAFPGTASNQFAWWQIDASGLLIQALGLVGLTWNIQTPSPRMLENSRRKMRESLAGSHG